MSTDDGTVWRTKTKGNTPTLHADPDCMHLNKSRSVNGNDDAIVASPASAFPDWVDRCRDCFDRPDPIGGAHLRACRRAAGLSKTALAYRVGVERATVRAWENGRWDPGVDNTRAIRETLADFGVDPAEVDPDDA